MGLYGESNTLAFVWDVEIKSDTFTKARISVNKKDRQTGEWKQDWCEYVCFFGTALAKKAASLKRLDKIRIKKFELTNKFDKDTQPWTKYDTIKIWDFEKVESAPPDVGYEGVDAGNGEVDMDKLIDTSENTTPTTNKTELTDADSSDLPW